MSKNKLGFSVLVLIILFLIISRFIKNPANFLIKNKPQELKEVVEKAMEESKGDYGIVIKNLKNNQTYYSNGDNSYETGSLYKLWVMLTVFDKIEKGEITEDEVLTEDVNVLNEKFNIDPDMAELTEGEITLSVKDALIQMITISHNYAALLLTEKVKVSEISKYLLDHKFNNSKVGEPPISTPNDIALFLEKLYKGELLNKENTQKVLDLLKQQKLNDGLPKYLPSDIAIAHKTGDIGWFKHDAGIVFSPNGDYIIVVMSKSDMPDAAQERIAEISKAIYDFFNLKPV